MLLELHSYSFTSLIEFNNSYLEKMLIIMILQKTLFP